MLPLLFSCKQEPAPSPSSPAAEPKRAPPGPTAPEAPTPGVAQHQFYGVYIKGQKAGWAESKRLDLSDPAKGPSVRFQVKAEFRIARLGQVLHTGIEDVVEFDRDDAGRLRSCRIVHHIGGEKAVTHCKRVGDDKMEVTQTSGSSTRTRVLPLTRMTLRDRHPDMVLERLKKAAGGTVTLWQLHPQELTDMELARRISAEKSIVVQGVPTRAYEIVGRNLTLGIAESERITAGGVSLEMTIGPGMRMVLEDKAVAQNPAASAPDVYRLSAVPIDKRLGAPKAITRLKVRLVGLPSTLAHTDARQLRHGEVVDIRRLEHRSLAEQPLPAADRKRWLESTHLIDHTDPSIVAFARKTALGDSPAARVAAMSRALHGQLRYTLATAPLRASAILRTGVGDCTEYARVLTAMARSQGLPAREVAGLIYAGDHVGGLTFHAWAEVYVDGRWLATDPTWDSTPIDATHITLTRGDQVPIVGVLGGLRAEVLAVER